MRGSRRGRRQAGDPEPCGLQVPATVTESLPVPGLQLELQVNLNTVTVEAFRSKFNLT